MVDNDTQPAIEGNIAKGVLVLAMKGVW